MIGCIAGVAPWIVVVQYFVGGGNFAQVFSTIPGFFNGKMRYNVGFVPDFLEFSIENWLII